MAGEKTEKASPKRKEDERKKGNIFQSREVVTVVSLIGLFYAIKLLFPIIVNAMQNSITSTISFSAESTYLNADILNQLLIKGLTSFMIAAMPLLLISCLIAIIFTMAQTRLLVSFKSMEFKASRMSPLQGFKKMFSMRGMVELVKSLIKVAVLAAILYNELKDTIPLMSRMMHMEPQQVMAMVGDLILSIVQTVAILFAFLAIFDYIYQWWDYEKNLRMTKQEIKEEYKQLEGDPQIKGKIKQRQQEQSRKRMMQGVPSADVVIRNPTHFAVAIRYQPEKDNAPVVVAKGVDELALRIVRIAEENNVIVTENVPLARGLYAAVDLDMEIPGQYYQAVAEVLAFVYSLKKKELK